MIFSYIIIFRFNPLMLNSYLPQFLQNSLTHNQNNFLIDKTKIKCNVGILNT